MRLWGKIIKDGHLVRDIVAENLSDDTRTHKILYSLDEICQELDLPRPIWLDKNIADFKRNAKTKFTQDSFIEHIEFDAFEIQIIEE